MMSVREGFVILLICFSMIGPVTSQDLPDEILDFLTLFNGDWDNKAQVEKGLTYNEFFHIKMIPVDIVALRPAATVFMEGSTIGIIRVLSVGVVSLESDGTISVTRYNFTDITKYTPGQFNPKDIANITYADLHGDKTCAAAFEFAGSDTLVGEWPECSRTYNDGKHLTYSDMFSCDHFTISVTLGVNETPTRVPVYFIRNGPRYPLVRAPATYVSPCDKKESG